MRARTTWGALVAAAVLLAGCGANVDPSHPSQSASAEPTESTSAAWSAGGGPWGPFNVNGPHGGNGGSQPYPLGCPGGEVLVGFHGHDGTVVDQVGLVCATMFEDGSLSSELWWGGPLGGGNGGNPFWTTCPGNQYVAAMAFGHDGNVVSRLMMYCADSAPGGARQSAGWVFVAGPPYGDLEYDNCNQWGSGNAVVGFTVRSGDYIDSMQTSCLFVDHT